MSDYPPPPPPPPPPEDQPGGYGSGPGQPPYGQQPPQQPPPAYGQYQQPGSPGYGMPGGPVDVLGRPLAEWWKRLVAIIIDGLIIAIPGWIIVFGILGFDTMSGGFSPAFSAGSFLIAIAGAAYYTVLNGGEKGQTVGKMVMTIQVRDAVTGGALGIPKGLARAAFTTVLSLVCGLLNLLDGLWPLWDQKRQALHDKVAGSVVVDAVPPRNAPPGGAGYGYPGYTPPTDPPPYR